MIRHFTYVDGACESAIVAWLKFEGYLFGKCIELSICDIKNPARSFFNVNKKSNVILILDLDVIIMDTVRRERLLKNINYFIESARSVLVITQKNNLEDELCLGLSFRENQLYRHFGAEGKKEYKAILANLHHTALKTKLVALRFTLFWQNKELYRFTKDPNIIATNQTLANINKK